MTVADLKNGFLKLSADLIVKNWDKSGGSNYKNYIKISTNIWSSRDRDKYYRVLSRQG